MRYTHYMFAGFLATLGAVGCTKDQSSLGTLPSFFTPEDQVTSVDRIADAQIRNGARDNSTLFSSDFTDGSLNSLGQAKLQDILLDRNAGDHVVIYVDSGDTVENRRGAIDRYLASNHLFQGAIDVKAGPNPHFTQPAAKALSDLAKSERGSFHSTTPAEAEASYSPSPAVAPPGSSH